MTIRITRDIGLSQIAEELDAPVEVVERRLNQGRALLQRTLGAGFEIEYIPLAAPEAPPAPEPALVGAPAARPSLADFVTDSLRGIEPLAAPGRGLTDEEQDA